MYCSKCGSQVPEGSKFCRNCGQLVNAEGQPSAPVYQPPAQAYQAPTAYQPPTQPAPAYQPAPFFTNIPQQEKKEKLRENPWRAIWVEGFILVFLGLLIAVACLFSALEENVLRSGGSFLHITSSILRAVSLSLLVGCGFYCVVNKKWIIKIIGVAGVLIGFVVASLIDFIILSFSGSNIELFKPFISLAKWAVLNNVVEFAAVLAVGGGVYLLAGLFMKKWRGMRMALSGVFAAIASVLYVLTGGIDGLRGNFQGYFPNYALPLNAYINAFSGLFIGAVSIVFIVMFVYRLCNLPGKRIHTGAGPKIWYGIVILANMGVLVATALSDTLGIWTMFLIVIFVIGLIMLLFGRSKGWYVYLLGVSVYIVLNFNLGLSGISSLGANVTVHDQQYYLVAFQSLVFVLNPLITWFVTWSGWNRIQTD